jgi:DNA modification methylase
MKKTIKRGELLQVGDHRFSCESIDHPLVDKLLDGVMADLFFSDPPWGDGHMKYWVTMNKKMSGEEYAPLSYAQLLDRIFSIIKHHVAGHIMIETGGKWADKLTADLAERFYNVRQILVVYDSGNKELPSVIVYASTHPDIRFDYEPVARKGYPVVKELIKAATETGDTVIDPCCGMGYTLQACIDHDLKFVGNEFNPTRLNKALARIK